MLLRGVASTKRADSIDLTRIVEGGIAFYTFGKQFTYCVRLTLTSWHYTTDADTKVCCCREQPGVETPCSSKLRRNQGISLHPYLQYIG